MKITNILLLMAFRDINVTTSDITKLEFLLIVLDAAEWLQFKHGLESSTLGSDSAFSTFYCMNLDMLLYPPVAQYFQ